MYWLQMSDFYDWPFIQTYDSLQDLKLKLSNSDFEAIHQSMKKEVEIRGNKLNRLWCDVIDRMKIAKLNS
jgi:hypothetical protein